MTATSGTGPADGGYPSGERRAKRKLRAALRRKGIPRRFAIPFATALTIAPTLTACHSLSGPPATLLAQCVGVTEPFAAAELGVPLSVFDKGWRTEGTLRWHRRSGGVWVADWRWKDADTGEGHRTTFAITRIPQAAATNGCGPQVAAISRTTMDGDDIGTMDRDQLVYAMRDRYAAAQSIPLGTTKPKPEPTNEGPTGRGWNQTVAVAAGSRRIPLAVPYNGIIQGLPLTVGQVVCPLLAQGFDLNVILADPESHLTFRNGPHSVAFELRQIKPNDPSVVSLTAGSLENRGTSVDQLRRFLLGVSTDASSRDHVCDAPRP